MVANRETYTRVAIVLHWLIALLVVGQLAGGIFMTKIPDAQGALKFELFQLHKSFGVTIFTLTLIRLLWRVNHPAPPLPSTMAGWEKKISVGVHALFYLLLLAIPLVGWAVVSSSPLADSIQTYIFGIIHLPHLPFFDGAANRKELSHEFAEVHEYLAFAMIALIALHVLAALKHQFVDRDEILGRMLPFVWRKS